MTQKPKIFSHTHTLCLPLVLCAALLLSSSGMAQTQLFTAQYQVSEASAAAGKVDLTIAIKVFNNDGPGVNGGTLTVSDPSKVDDFVTFENVWVSEGGSAHFSRSVTIPESIYESWQSGSKPMLRLDYTDTGGNPTQQLIWATVAPAENSLQ